MSRNEKRRMGIYVVTGIVLVAVVAVLSVAVLKKRDSKDVQAQAANPSYMDENGGEYIAAFLKGMPDSTITVDIAEFITDDDTERIKELNLSEEDMPDGYYIYNPDEETVTWKLDGQTIYTFIDWNGDFTGSDYPEEYTTTDAAEFQKYIGTYEDSQPGDAVFLPDRGWNSKDYSGEADCIRAGLSQKDIGLLVKVVHTCISEKKPVSREMTITENQKVIIMK